MNPKLIALAGPQRGATYELDEAAFYIGRDHANQLCLKDQLVSRQHALLIYEVGQAAQVELRDLDSANGTMVNGVPVGQRRLAHGDQLAIGNSLFLFLSPAGAATPPPGPVQLDNSEVTGGISTLFQPEDALYLHVEKVLAALPHPERLARDLGALLRISIVINPIRQARELLPRLLELIFEVIPARRGAILLEESGLGESGEGFAHSASLDRELGPGRPMQVSRTVVEQVLCERVTLLSSNVPESATLGGTPSLIAAQAQSLLATPLLVFERALGVVYLTTDDPAAGFDEDHQELLTAIAGIAAVAVENVLRAERLQAELQRQRIGLRELIGESKPMRTIARLIAKAAPSDSTVLIRGESGTGKELAARAIHAGSPRAARPFVAVNCATLHEALFESELFGHERGAFTGAVNQKRGLLEAADGGTIFLDEIGELSPALQAKLLRALQEKEFLRVGGTRPVKVDVRVVAATNRDLEAMAKEGHFREDLYYRLNVFPLTLPPLRERREDVLLLARYFLRQFSEACKRPVRGFTQPALNCLLRYDWPGNVRELANAVERAVTLGESDFIHPFDLPERISELDAPSEAASLHLPTALKETKRRLILQAVEQAQGNLTAAAKLLGVDAANLHRLIRELEIKPEIEILIHRLKAKSDLKSS